MAQTEVKKFIEETQRQIDEEGLVAMSGTDFSRGDSIRRVLKAKQHEYRIYSGGMSEMINPDGSQNYRIRKGKFASVAQIAQSLNQMNEAIKNKDYVTYTDDFETFVEGESCGPNCECYPSLQSDADKLKSKQAQAIIMDCIIKTAEQKQAADDEVERILQLEKDGKTKPYYDY